MANRSGNTERSRTGFWLTTRPCGSRVGQNVSHADIFPTVCEALGLETPRSVSGRSLLPAVSGRKLAERKIYFESLYPYYQRGWAPLRGLIDGGKKYLDSPIPELYDLERDFGERENLAGRTGGDGYRRSLEGLLSERTAPAERANRAKPDAKARETLASLGYISGPAGNVPREFGPGDDVKVLLPFYNKTIEASDLHASGGSARAAEMIKEVIAERPDLDVAYTKLAAIYRDRGRPADAFEVLRQGRAAAPSSYEIFSTYVNFLMDGGLYREVIEAVGRATLRQMDYDPEIWNYLGLARMNTGDASGAVAAFEKALAVDSENAAVYSNLGTLYLALYMRDGDGAAFENGIRNFRRAIACDPAHAMAYNGLGAAFKRAGRVDEAVAAWEKALELDPGLGASMYNLGVAYLETGNTARALVLFKRYLEKFGAGLSPEEREKIEELIARCQK
jgi:tetratricopeptide (TPR) repeat protein